MTTLSTNRSINSLSSVKSLNHHSSSLANSGMVSSASSLPNNSSLPSLPSIATDPSFFDSNAASLFPGAYHQSLSSLFQTNHSSHSFDSSFDDMQPRGLQASKFSCLWIRVWTLWFLYEPGSRFSRLGPLQLLRKRTSRLSVLWPVWLQCKSQREPHSSLT
ncbi:hypothetical protein SERLA73DRAFT_71153 [Serpula lacrymans var. lacrymans S7.3]|uniref:Uncharacterized protein n=1 Tax=Serpula lacrymans var. lacrymans (strain S7.3) TaxID=936435 RepID=F8PPC0_SERL3|nr:hypothetical protein SERLA73DRAFT_71153 [Serpula lacrymans var. lacrymans S7.3]